MLPQLSDYDWIEAFGFASFSIEDVEQVIAESTGCNDGDSWLSFGKLKDGRYYFLSAWCDYTGWDCQSGGDCFEHADRETVERFGMSDAERERLGIVLEVVDGPSPISDIDD